MIDKLIFKCKVNGILGKKVIKNKLVHGMCGLIKCGDENICGSKSECEHQELVDKKVSNDD